MAPHSSTLTWRIPWTEEPGGLQSMGSLRVGHDRVTSLWLSLSCIGEGNGNPLQCSCLENPRDMGAWWVAISGVAQSRTWQKWLSSSSSSRKGLWGIGTKTECVECLLSHFSHVPLFVISRTVEHQAPLPMGFSTQKYWSVCHANTGGLPCPPPPGDLFYLSRKGLKPGSE